MSIWLRRLLSLRFHLLQLFVSTVLYILYLFYILKLQKLLVYGIFHYLILNYQLLNIASWGIHLLLVVEIITRLCIERPVTILTRLNLIEFWLSTYEYWRYWWEIAVKSDWMIVLSFFVSLALWWLLVMTLNQILSTSWFLSTLKSEFPWKTFVDGLLILLKLLLTNHIVRMHLKRSGANTHRCLMVRVRSLMALI